MSMNFKSLIAATLLVGVSAFASAQTPASGTVQELAPTAAAKAPAEAGAKKSAVTAKKKPAKTVVAKKRVSKQKPGVKLSSARKHTNKQKQA